MAEVIKKKISDLDGAAGPLVGTELIELSVTGISKKGTWSNLFGSGWWAKLAAAFSTFKAPDADHADNADTLGVGLETPSDFHDAAQLTGAVPLASIPATLTGKTAEFATNATNVANVNAVNGLSFANPTTMANTPTTVTLSQFQSWTPDPGFYFVYTRRLDTAAIPIFYFSYFNGTSWIGGDINYPQYLHGCLITKGNTRYTNLGSNNTAIYYWKLA